MSRYLRPHLAAAPPYVPGEQLTRPVIKLNTNECPYPPSSAVIAAVQEVAPRLMRYPRPDADNARRAFAETAGLPENMVFVGNGSDEILRIAFQAYVAPGDRVAWSTPTYTLYEILANFAEAKIIDVPRAEADFAVNIRQLGSVGAKLTILATPNSPTGTVTPLDEIETLLSFGGLVLVDEAYADFQGTSAMDLVRRHDNLIVVRTLSKSYALAGLRVGFAVASPDLIADFQKLKDSYNVSLLADAGAAAALRDVDYAVALRQKVVSTRSRLEKRLTELGFMVHKSGANFIFAVPPDKNGRRVYDFLRKENIIVRWFETDPRISEGIRITVGPDDEIDRLLEVIERHG